MTTAKDRVSYIFPNVNASGAGLMLSETFTPPSLNLSEGTNKMLEWLGRPAKNVPRHHVPPLRVSISRKAMEYVEEKYKKAGAEKGKFVVTRGIESDSAASMQSVGDKESLLPIQIWADIATAIGSNA